MEFLTFRTLKPLKKKLCNKEKNQDFTLISANVLIKQEQ